MYRVLLKERKGKPVMPGTRLKPDISIKERIYNDNFSSGLCNNKILVQELAELWFLDIKSVMRPSSYALYQNYAKKYILPHIGGMPAAGFNASILSEVLRSLYTGNNGKEEALSQYTVYLMESMVHSMFHYGAEKSWYQKFHLEKQSL